MTAQEHEVCPHCGSQPEVIKGRTYWTAHCPKRHFPYNVIATPMKTKRAALSAWDRQLKSDYAAPPSPLKEKQ